MPDETAAKAFIQAVKDMKARFNIGDTIPEIKEKDIPKLAGYADKEANPLYPVPVLMDAKTLEQFYYKLMKDNTHEMRYNMEATQINKLVQSQRHFFLTGTTLDINVRIDALKKLYSAIKKHENEIFDALYKDLGKSQFESYMCESRAYSQ